MASGFSAGTVSECLWPEREHEKNDGYDFLSFEVLKIYAHFMHFAKRTGRRTTSVLKFGNNELTAGESDRRIEIKFMLY